jgi:predicted RND superfamily exporter protein
VPSPTNEPSPRTRRFVSWTLRHGRLLWAVAVLLAIPATLRTVNLYRNLRSEIEELLPRDAPSVVAIQELRKRMAGLQYLGVVVDFGRPENLPAGERLIDDLSERIQKFPADLVSAVRTGFKTERDFIESHLALLLELPDLQTIRGRIEDRVRWQYGKEMGTLLDDKEPAPALDFADIAEKYERRVGGPQLAGNRFSSPKLGLTLLLVEVGGFSTSADKAKDLMRRVQAEVAALGGTAHYAPGMRLGFTGDVAISAEETDALKEDLRLSSVLVIFSVILVIVVFYRWPRSVPILFLPLGLGAVYAFALASLPPFNITELNSNTAFLGSIIIGNGINFGIIQLARYVEARRRGVAVEPALAVSLWATRKGTLSAALAAGAAYVSLTAMQFRGFRQFGVIGGLGMLLCWGTTFVLAPSLVAWLDRGRLAGKSPASQTGRITSWLARWVTTWPRAIVLVAAVLTLVAGWQLRHLGNDQLEHNFSRLRRLDTWTSGEGYWGKKMDVLLGRYLTPTVLLADSVAEARAIASRLREEIKRPPLANLVASVRSLEDIIPIDQADKSREVEAIRRKMTPNLRKHLSGDDAEKLDRLIGSGPLPFIVESDVPHVFTTGLRERDGAIGRAVLVFPNPGDDLWKGETISRFVETLREVARIPVATGGRPARVAGGPPLSADIIQSMRHDGPLASALAFAGVMATVILLFRWGLATPFVLGSLIVGVLWLLAVTMTLGIKINFINFIAFPITFGIGVDYAVNVMARYLRDGGRDIGAAIRGTGGAVALCSITTMLG